MSVRDIIRHTRVSQTYHNTVADKRIREAAMAKPREITAIWSSGADPMGSYTGTAVDLSDRRPVQDADDL